MYLDNIACPMASSLGDVVTLGILAGCAQALLANMGMYAIQRPFYVFFSNNMFFQIHYSAHRFLC